MQLAWKDNSNGEATFKLERASYGGSTCGSFVALTILPAGTTSYTDKDSTFTAGTTYCYRICASSAVGDSSWVSNTAKTFYCSSGSSCAAAENCYNGCCLPLAQTPPVAPTRLDLTSTVCNQMQLTWTDNSNNEAGFKIERASYVSSACGAYVQVATAPAGSTSYTDNDPTLTAGASYCYRICATNAVGDSSWTRIEGERTFYCSSSSSCAAAENCYNGCCLPLAQTPPAAPTRLDLTSTVCNQMQLTWTDNSNNEAGFKIERASYVSSACGAYVQVATAPADSTSYTDNDPTPTAAGYCYRICATNAVGDSSWSNATRTSTGTCTSTGSGTSTGSATGTRTGTGTGTAAGTGTGTGTATGP